MYALATVPLIKRLTSTVKQTWYADDAAATGKIVDLQTWWNEISHEYINELLKPFLKLGEARLPIKQTLTLKLGVTLVLTVTQVYVFINLRQVTGMPP